MSSEIDEIRTLIRAAGLRCTAARVAVVQELRKAASPRSHAEIAEELVPQGYDKATVFRNLVDLAQVGLVVRSELGDHVWRFELRSSDDPEGGRHPHFVCVECGGVTCLSGAELNEATRRQASKIGRVTEILLKGQCRECG